MASRQARILILCKTSCVAGMEDDGRLIRLFPVPFRLVDGDKQFKKWQWVTARIDKAPNDRRPENHKVFVDTIVCDGDPLSTSRGWRARRDQLRKIPIFDDLAALGAARTSRGVTLGLLRPSRTLGLERAVNHVSGSFGGIVATQKLRVFIVVSAMNLKARR
jgi:hypothetical protein